MLIKPKGSFYIFRHYATFSERKKSFKKSLLRFLSLRYSTDFRRSRLVLFPFNENVKFLKNCPYDFHRIEHIHSTPKRAPACAKASKSYDWDVRNIAKVSLKMAKKQPFFHFFRFSQTLDTIRKDAFCTSLWNFEYLFQAAEELKARHLNGTSVKLEFVHYSQSSSVANTNDSSVSYAAGIFTFSK